MLQLIDPALSSLLVHTRVFLLLLSKEELRTGLFFMVL